MVSYWLDVVINEGVYISIWRNICSFIMGKNYFVKLLRYTRNVYHIKSYKRSQNSCDMD